MTFQHIDLGRPPKPIDKENIRDQAVPDREPFTGAIRSHKPPAPPQ